MKLAITELALLVLAGLSAATYAKTEGAKSNLAAVIGVATAVLIYIVCKHVWN